MIHERKHGFLISSYNVWKPGVYDSKRTANYAFRFSDDKLANLQGEKNKTTGIITYDDLVGLKGEK